MNRAALLAVLPPSLAPRGLSRIEAATYIGVSATTFDKMVADGRMPQPKMVDTRKVWDRLRLDSFFAALPDKAGAVDGDDDIWGNIAP